MGKRMFFGIIIGVLCSGIAASMGYMSDDLKWWLIVIPATVLITVIYHNCLDD
jgi:hypothetical protein